MLATPLSEGTANKTQFANSKAMGTHKDKAGKKIRNAFKLGSEDSARPNMRAYAVSSPITTDIPPITRIGRITSRYIAGFL